MKSSKFRILFDYSKKIPFEIFIPEVVYDELVNKYKEKLMEYIASYDKSIIDIKTILNYPNLEYLSFDVDEQVGFYIDYLDNMLNSKKFKLIPYPVTYIKT